MKKLALSILAFALFIFLVFWLLSYTQNPVSTANLIYDNSPKPQEYTTLDSNKLFDLVNQYRVSENFPPLVKDEKLCVFANHRAVEIQKDFSHDGLKIIESLDWFGFFEVGENLVADYPSEQMSFQSWIDSPSHLENIVKPYRYTCVSCINQRCVQIFAR